MSRHKLLILLSIVLCVCCFLLPAQARNDVVLVIGQDNQSIVDYVEATHGRTSPDGIMAYTAINDLSGLSEAADHGAGVNHVDDLLGKYPDLRVVQLGLYMRYMLEAVVQGHLDDNIDRLGEWIRHSGRQVYLRIGYEFDNPENEYVPEQYIPAYRYIVARLRKNGVRNVCFVWHTIAWQDKAWPAYDPLRWYPGSQYVDWVGISFFDSKQDAERNKAARLARQFGKPLMIAESSPFFQHTDEEKLKWLASLFGYIDKNHVRYLSYINVDWDALEMFQSRAWGDARLENSPVVMQEWLNNLERFRQGI
jgi:hypothetical protein